MIDIEPVAATSLKAIELCGSLTATKSPTVKDAYEAEIASRRYGHD